MADTTPELAVRPSCARTVTGWTIFFMVLLRISIGWHFAYEGLYKIVAERDWRATGYLLQSTGPLRPTFRAMVHDPDGLIRLTAESVKQRIDDRYALLVEHYALTAEQRAETDAYAKRKQIGAPDKPDDQIFVDAIFADPDFQQQKADYELLLKEIEEMERALTGPVGPEYNKERLVYRYGKKAQALAALLARAEAPLRAMEMNTISKLTPEQLGRGQAPGEKSQTAFIDFANMWGLTLVGACLMLGLFTRFAALGGVGLLALYYFAMPPWLGYPQGPMSEGHYLIVNKNLIEAIALLMIATSRVGRWGGLDAYLGALCGRGRGQAEAA